MNVTTDIGSVSRSILHNNIEQSQNKNIVSVYDDDKYVYIHSNQSPDYYYENCMDKMLNVDGYSLNRKLYCGPCGQYHQKEWPLEPCGNCAFLGCPHCLRPDLKLPACMLCITGDPKFKSTYTTDNPTRSGNIKCVAEYSEPGCIFFKDPYGYYYRGKEYNQWTADEKEAYFFKPSKKEYYTFKQHTKDLIYNLSKSKKRSITTTYYTFPGNIVGAIQLKQFFNKTNISVYQRFTEFQINERWRKFKILQSQKKQLWKDYFDLVYSPLSTAISTKRIQIMGGRGWVVGAGAKKETHASSLTNERLFTVENKNFYGWQQHVETTMDILHVAAKHGIISEKEIDTFYGPNLCLLCNNSITYTGGSCMHIHQDLSEPEKNDGFDLRLIAIGTFDIQDFNNKPGNKFLSFSGTIKMIKNNMNIKQETGDLTLVFPPASTKWWHFVPCLQARRATTIQWRRWLGKV